VDRTENPGALPPGIPAQVKAALDEDIGPGDVTARLIPADQRALARVISREAATLCGVAWFDETFAQIDSGVRVEWLARDGDPVSPGATLCTVSGTARALLTGERTALNFLQLLSGTATAARLHADAVAGTRCRILDTRKTVPGLRLAQKYAVRCGGASNHRLGLYDMVLIKENHIAAAGSIAAAIRMARKLSPGVPVEVEVESLDELDLALAETPDIIMLDELTLEDMREAVARRDRSGCAARLEASGGISLATLREVALTGVDFVSVGGLTKHVRAVDLSMRLEFSAA
jgi:nicotinate-nucleotide pyrophosphorylase (carboxylating)